jgi:hypothetical protein
MNNLFSNIITEIKRKILFSEMVFRLVYVDEVFDNCILLVLNNNNDFQIFRVLPNYLI